LIRHAGLVDPHFLHWLAQASKQQHAITWLLLTNDEEERLYKKILSYESLDFGWFMGRVERIDIGEFREDGI